MKPLCLLIPIVFLYLPVTARADQVTLKNGDRFTGKLVSVKDGIITFKLEGPVHTSGVNYRF